MLKPPPRAGQYQVIYADPPWRFATYSEKGKGKSAEQHYACMSLSDIAGLPIQKWASNDCALFLWATDPMLMDALCVAACWEFNYKTVAFTWVKTGKDNCRPIGCGYWTRANPEMCLLFTRGKPKRVARDVRQLVEAPRREHSRKPDEVRLAIERLMGDVPRLEMFARPPLPAGWDCWGNECDA